MNKAKKDELKLSRETRTVQILGFEEESSGALMPPVHFATTFARDAEHYQTLQGRSYLRCDGPTQELAEQVLADLEGASGFGLFLGNCCLHCSVSCTETGGTGFGLKNDLPWSIEFY